MTQEAEKFHNMQNRQICDLMNVSDVISNHINSKRERVEKLKDVVQNILPEKMETYFHISEDMSADPRFNDEDMLNSLLTCIKYDLIRYIAEI